VTNSVAQGLMLEFLLWDMVISGVGGGAECPLSVGAGGVASGGMVRAPEGEWGCRLGELEQPGTLGQQGS